MLNPAIRRSVVHYRRQFQSAKPFKHLCLDDFLDGRVADELLSEFPTFDPHRATNEFGEVGGKAVQTDLGAISPMYRRLYDYLSSEEFLGTIADLTGIPDLRHDPRMYGGGTHENRHGQDLDPHVDFNYDEGRVLHRRLNLIVYLNQEWDPRWGGSIELHSNPRRPAENEVKEFAPLFNRAVLFETHENSWHGFERIDLPAERRHDSRKSISIYLYTRERPPEEIAPMHGTFYVQRPLPAKYQAGYQLLPEDVAALTQMLSRRDKWIEQYQKQELALNGVIAERDRYLGELLAAVRVPATGYILQESQRARGLYADGWVGPEVEVRLKPLRPITQLVVRGWLPKTFPQGGGVTALIDGHECAPTTITAGEFEYTITPPTPLKRPFALSLRCTQAYNGARRGENQDARDLAFMLSELRALHA